MDNLHHKKDGKLDMRYKSSKEAIKDEPIQQGELIIGSNEQVLRSCDAVKFGKIILNDDGTVSNESPAVKSGELRVNKDGTLDMRFKAAKEAKKESIEEK